MERIRAKTRVAGYDECYPGLVESYDAMGDSDDEADYTKMDMGNKKGPVGRWDFESQVCLVSFVRANCAVYCLC